MLQQGCHCQVNQNQLLCDPLGLLCHCSMNHVGRDYCGCHPPHVGPQGACCLPSSRGLPPMWCFTMVDGAYVSKLI
jgi:hypothetical protein